MKGRDFVMFTGTTSVPGTLVIMTKLLNKWMPILLIKMMRLRGVKNCGHIGSSTTGSIY